MSIHISNLEEVYFNQIKNGEKIYELRVFDEKRRKIKNNDKWIFVNKNSNKDNKIILQTLVRQINIYESFEEAINETDISKLLPGIETKEECLEIYNNFDGYEEKSKELGVVRFTLYIIEN